MKSLSISNDLSSNGGIANIERQDHDRRPKNPVRSKDSKGLFQRLFSRNGPVTDETVLRETEDTESSFSVKGRVRLRRPK